MRGQITLSSTHWSELCLRTSTIAMLQSPEREARARIRVAMGAARCQETDQVEQAHEDQQGEGHLEEARTEGQDADAGDSRTEGPRQAKVIAMLRSATGATIEQSGRDWDPTFFANRVVVRKPLQAFPSANMRQAGFSLRSAVSAEAAARWGQKGTGASIS